MNTETGGQQLKYLRRVRHTYALKPVLNLTCLEVLVQYQLSLSFSVTTFHYTAKEKCSHTIITTVTVDIKLLMNDPTCHPVTMCLFFPPSVEVNNFLKIDENQNEEVENGQLADNPVSRKLHRRCSHVFLSNCGFYIYASVFLIFQMYLHSKSSLAEETQ